MTDEPEDNEDVPSPPPALPPCTEEDLKAPRRNLLENVPRRSETHSDTQPAPPQEPAPDEAWAMKSNAALLPAESRIPDQTFIRPCREIAGNTNGNFRLDEGFAERYSRLTQPLPLAGGESLKRDRSGRFRLICALRAEVPWMEPAIDRIETQLRIQNWAGRPWLALRPMCLVGPPGSGKSHFARALARHAGLAGAVLDLAGASDNRTIEGTARGYSQAQPAWPVMMLDQLRIANPVLQIEEIDKAGGSNRNGRPLDSLLTMIEPSTARSYFDKCLLAAVDISHVNWLFTCNKIEPLPSPLRSRLEVIEVKGPEPEHFDMVLLSVTRALAMRWELPMTQMPELPPQAVRVLRDNFARTRSVRRLQHHAERLFGLLVPAVRGPVH